MSEVGGVEIETGHPWADAARILLVLAPGGAVLAVTLYVLVIYGRVYLMDRRIAQEFGRKSRWHGLLPRHVSTIAISYSLLVVFTLVMAFGKLRDPFTWRIPVASVAYLLGLWSLWDVLGHERAKMIHPPSDHGPSTRP